MMYEIVVPLRVAFTGEEADLGTVTDQVTDELAIIDERTPELLDYAVSSDASDNTAVFEVTAEASDEMEALTAAVSWIRTAIHSAGGATPGWGIGGLGTVSVEQLARSR